MIRFNELSKNAKMNLGIAVLCATFVMVAMLSYLVILPKLVESKTFQTTLSNEFNKMTGATLVIENPDLKTSLSPKIGFSVKKVQIQKESDIYLDLENFKIAFSLAKLLSKRIELKDFKISRLYVDASKLMKLFPPEEKEKEPVKSDYEIGFFDSDISINNVEILFNENNVSYDVKLDGICIAPAIEKEFLHFNLAAIIKSPTETIHALMKDESHVYMTKKALFVNDCELHLNQSIIGINAYMDKRNRFDIGVCSRNFRVENIIDIINSNLLIPNGSELVSMFGNVKGLLDFDFALSNDKMHGDVNLKGVNLALCPVDNIPLTITNGNIEITDKDIFLKNFKGYYNNKDFNGLSFDGEIKDYVKSFEAKINADATVTNDFMENYFSKIVGFPIVFAKSAKTKLAFTMKNNIPKVKWIFWVDADNDILVDSQPLSKYKLARALVAEMEVVDSMLNLNRFDYYITLPNKDQNMEAKVHKKLLELQGKIDLSNNNVSFKEMGFKISEPLPSEFLNMVARCELFRNGTVQGELKAIESKMGIKLLGDIKLEKIRVPSQRIYVESGELSTTFDNINIKANGRYRRTKYVLDGQFNNNIAFPIVVNNLSLDIDKINIGKMLEAMNRQGTQTNQVANLDDDDDVVQTFDMSNIIIKNCTFQMDEGIYNSIRIKDLLATMTFDKNSVLELSSNKFSFAEGTSSCKLHCDLKNHLYNVKLGVKDVDSNIIAGSILGMPDEISGKAKGYINLNTDDSLKLNGEMKFMINDGAIGTVGFLQYVLNVATIFRNPLAMISPITILDLVNVPKGEFKTIDGILVLKDNVIEQMKIKSKAPLLSSYIIGRYDLEHSDASMRIYTKFSNKNSGVYGILRFLSLSSIARHLPMSNRTMSNYYNPELKQIPSLGEEEKNSQIYLTRVEGDVEHNNFISSLKRLK